MRSRPQIVLALLAAALTTVGCSSNTDPHGSPVLLYAYWVSGGVRTQVWANTSSGSDASPQAAPVPAAGQEVDFVFDRLLDGSRIEDTITQNGVQMPVPKAMPPVTVTWPDAATVMSAPPFAAQVFYNSEPIFEGTTAYVFLRPVEVGFPSSDTVTFALDKTGLTSAYGDQMIGPAQISVATAGLSASFRLPSGNDGSATVATNYQLPVVFSNRVAGAAAVEPFIHVEANGLPLPVVVAADTSDLTVVYVSPASCLGGWPIGVSVGVTVAAGAPDAFGGAMTSQASTSFMAAGASNAAPDGGCASSPVDAATD
jgi:hypothetical protein